MSNIQQYLNSSFIHVDKMFEGIEVRSLAFADYDNYWVSRCGKVLSEANSKPRWLSQRERQGYLAVAVSGSEGRRDIDVHRLVLMAYVPPHKPLEELQTNHKDLNKQNNHISNLEWCTSSENLLHSRANQEYAPSSGQFTDNQVKEICELLSEGMGASAVARRLGYARMRVQHIKARRTYTHISKRYNWEWNNLK